MPPLEVCDLNQWAVVWPFVGQDNHGMPIVGDPSEIQVRWVLNDAVAIDPQGNTITNSGNVFTSEAVAPLSIMWQGRLQDMVNDYPVTDLHQVIKANSTPDIKARNTRFEYSLMRYSQKLPALSGT